MSDTRFDGRKVYEFGRASQAVFDIRGKYLHKANSAKANRNTRSEAITSPSLQRLDARISTSGGNRIHKAHSASQAIYEIR